MPPFHYLIKPRCLNTRTREIRSDGYRLSKLTYMILSHQDLTVSVCLYGVEECRDVQLFKRETWFETLKKITIIICRPICSSTLIFKKPICFALMFLDFLNIKNMYMNLVSNFWYMIYWVCIGLSGKTKHKMLIHEKFVSSPILPLL